MTIQSHGHEHELEPQYGLPERLPANEKMLWQGSPDFRAVALQVFHLRKAAIYFAVLLVWRAATALQDGGGMLDALLALSWPLPLALAALASLAALAWLTARTTVYTLTDKRVVMRIGIVLTLTFNIPLRSLRAAALRRSDARSGDIVINLAGPDHIAWLHLWPHARPWHVAKPQPMLRGVENAPHVAALLAKAWADTMADIGAGSSLGAAGLSGPAVATPAAHSASSGAPLAQPDPRDGRSAPHWQPSPT